MSLLNELKRRNVFRVGIAYLVASWLLLQITDILIPILTLSESAGRLVFLLLVIGFVPALILAWAFELTPEGIKRESKVDPDQSITTKTGRKLDFVIIGILVTALAIVLIERFTLNKHESQPELVAQKNEPVIADTAENSTEKSVAVLPFVNMSSDAEQEYFSDGLSEELLNHLAKNKNLRVAARTSSFQFKGQNLDVAEIARKLKVDHILEGSVRKSGNRLRITAQLINAADGYHLWSETYEREIVDIFAIQDDISVAISKALEAELGMVPVTSELKPTENLAAYNLYLRGRYLLAARGEDNLVQAIALFERAVEKDPKFSKAWSSLAISASLVTGYGSKISDEKASGMVRHAAAMALSIDPQDAEAYIARARLEATYDWDIEKAGKSFKRAIEIAPNNVEVANLYGDFLMVIGDLAAAEIAEQHAIDLDPLAAVHYSDMATLMAIQQRNAEALEFARTSARLSPDLLVRSDSLVVALIRSGQFAEAKQTIERLSLISNEDSDAGLITYWWLLYYYQQKDIQNLRLQLEKAAGLADNEKGYLDHTYPAFFLLWIGENDKAMEELRLAYSIKEGGLSWPDTFFLPEQISDDPVWLEFWQQPGLQELMNIRRTNDTGKPIGFWQERVSP